MFSILFETYTSNYFTLCFFYFISFLSGWFSAELSNIPED